MKTKTLYLLLPFFSLLAFSCHQEYKKVDQEATPVLKGLYLGQKPPDTVPEIFAPGIVSNGMDNRDMAIMPDGREIYFTTTVGGTEYVTILYSKEETGSWTRPEVVSFAGNPEYMYYEPCLALDGQKLFFTSNMPINDSIAISEPNIWFVIRHDDTWSDPQLMDTVVNSNHHEYFPSVAENGTMYFTRGSETGEFFIYRSRFVDGKYTKAEKLPKQVNSGKNRFNAFVARDESYLILSVYGLSETFGGMDYYIVFRNEDDTWEDPINLGNKINTNGSEEYSPYVSPDGRYFFFMSKRSIPEDSIPEKLSYEFLQKMHNHCNNGHSDIYWVAAQIIEDLKPKELK